MKRRTQSATERDELGIAAKRAREATPIAFDAVPDEIFEGDITSQYEGEQRDLAREAAFNDAPAKLYAHLSRKLDQERARNDRMQADLLARADRSVDFGRGLAMKIVGAILGIITLIATAAAGYFAGARH